MIAGSFGAAAVRALRQGAAWVVRRLGRDAPLLRIARPGYEAALWVASGGRGIRSTINGVPCRLHHRFRWIPQTYEYDVASFLARRVRPGAVCIDVGANVGLYVIQFAHWSQPTGQIVAFEPNPVARRTLVRHVRLNRLAHRVEVVPFAVGERDGEATLHVTAFDGRSRLELANPLVDAPSRPVTVRLTSLDGFCARRQLRPDWILIDIEGFELSALQGARRTIEEGNPSLGLVVECHPSLWAVSHTSRRDFEGILADLHLEPTPLTGQHDPLSEYGVVHLRYRER